MNLVRGHTLERNILLEIVQLSSDEQSEEVDIEKLKASLRRFISTLTREGPGGLPRPIEVHAHDPLRYVGADMLGWLHQPLASERELLLALLDPDAVADTGPSASQVSKVSENDVVKSVSDLTFVLDRMFEGVCRPFKVRVEQVLQSQPNLIVLCKLRNTLEFYSYTASGNVSESRKPSVLSFYLYFLDLYDSCNVVDNRFARERNSSL